MTKYLLDDILYYVTVVALLSLMVVLCVHIFGTLSSYGVL